MITCSVTTALPALDPHSEQSKEKTYVGSRKGWRLYQGSQGFLGTLGLHLLHRNNATGLASREAEELVLLSGNIWGWTTLSLYKWERRGDWIWILYYTCHTLVVQTELKLMRLERQLADEVWKAIYPNRQLIRKNSFSYLVSKIGEEKNKMSVFKQKIRWYYLYTIMLRI